MIVAALLGFGLGFVGSIPVAGPIAALVLARGLDGRLRSGMFIAIGASVAEAGYAFLAFYGFGALLSDVGWLAPVAKAGGAVVLTVVGLLLLRRRPAEAAQGDAARAARFGGYGDGVLGFSITALNPTLIATWTTAMTVVYSTGLVTFSSSSSVAFALGACAGIVAWFAILLALIGRLGERFGQRGYGTIRRATGLLVLLLAAGFAVQLIAHFF